MGISEDLLRTVIDSIDAPIVVANGKGKYVFANAKYLNLFSPPMLMDQFTQLDVHDFVKGGYTNVCIYDEVMERQSSTVVLLKNRNKGVDTSETTVSAKPIFNAEGKIEYIVYTNFEMEEIWNMYRQPDNISENDYNQITSSKGNVIICENKETRELFMELMSVAQSNASILLMGESGTGKEVFAHYIHDCSQRRDKDMVILNCASIPENMLESELFGYEKGAFTGASSKGKPGLIELANGSTLFLDEINSLPLNLQGKLLRTLETKRIRRVGGLTDKEVDFRIVSATNQDLFELAQKGEFRLDLFYRLSVVPVTVPPLRDRPEDIVPLAEFFMDQFCQQYGKEMSFAQTALNELQAHSWPGNIRELRNLVERVVVSYEEKKKPIIHIPESYFMMSEKREKKPADKGGEELPEVRQIVSALMENDYNVSLAAKQLGLSRRGLYNKMERYNIEVVSRVMLGGKPYPVESHTQAFH